MNKQTHAHLLLAYIARLTLADVKAIAEQQERCTYAWLHYGNNGQIEERYKLESIVKKAIDNMLDHDLQIIENVIRSTDHA